MLSKSNINIEQFFPIFAETGVPVAFLVPTETGYYKSIMDATGPVRELLKSSGVHDYTTQNQGPDFKVIVRSYFVSSDHVTETSASLYRPITKKGDPRIWFSHLKQYCNPCDLLAIIVIDGSLYVFNLSNTAVRTSLLGYSYAYDILAESSRRGASVAEELLERITAIHHMGFLESITPGDPGVGDTLEHALGINRNNSREPDYKGIELKTSRLTRNGAARGRTRNTLFAKVPDKGLTYREIVERYGRSQIPRGATEPRLQLYETFRVNRVNAYGLTVEVDSTNDELVILYVHPDGRKSYVSSWHLQTLRDALLNKHHETFWVKAVSETRHGTEYFRYDTILHTKNPNVSLLAPLIEAGKITFDLAAHIDPDGSWRDHGVLFKMLPEDLPLLLGTPTVYNL